MSGCADITYIPVRRGFLYLVAIMDWASRHVLAWRLSNTLDAGFCTDALDEALARHGTPEIFTTDQGSQFTGCAFTGRVREAGIPKEHPRILRRIKHYLENNPLPKDASFNHYRPARYLVVSQFA